MATIACDLYGAVIQIDRNASGAWQTSVANALQQMKSSQTGMDLYNQLQNSSNTHTITPGDSNSNTPLYPANDYNGVGTGTITKFNLDITQAEGWERPHGPGWLTNFHMRVIAIQVQQGLAKQMVLKIMK